MMRCIVLGRKFYKAQELLVLHPVPSALGGFNWPKNDHILMYEHNTEPVPKPDDVLDRDWRETVDIIHDRPEAAFGMIVDDRVKGHGFDFGLAVDVLREAE